MQQIIHKVPQGKLLRIKIDGKQSIDYIQIAGDFFCHPESAIADMEKLIIKTPIPIDKNLLLHKLENYVADHQVEIIGFSLNDIIECIAQVTT